MDGEEDNFLAIVRPETKHVLLPTILKREVLELTRAISKALLYSYLSCQGRPRQTNLTTAHKATNLSPEVGSSGRCEHGPITLCKYTDTSALHTMLRWPALLSDGS